MRALHVLLVLWAVGLLLLIALIAWAELYRAWHGRRTRRRAARRAGYVDHTRRTAEPR